MPDIELTFGAVSAEVETSRKVTDDTSANHRLVVAIRSGDEEAFGRFHRKYAPLVHGILLSKMPPDEVEDVVQEVFLAAFRGIETLRDPEALGSWLVKLARNHAAGFYRSRKTSEELPEDIKERSSFANEAAEVLLAIRSLPEAYSETLTLRLVEGMTGEEIAKATGLSSGSVRVNLHRGMEMLRKRLGIEVKK